MGDYNLHQHPHPCNELRSDDRRLSTDSVSVWRRSFVMGHGDEEGSSGGRAADGCWSDGLPPLSKTGGGEMSSGSGDGRNSGPEIEENKAEVNRLRELQMKQQQQQSEANAWDNNAFQMPPPELQASELNNLVSPRPNQEDGERTVGGNGLGRFNSTALRRMIEYKWMPTPGLRQGFEPNSNLLGQQGMEKPN
ncbi:hypothetical protein SDJN03_19279, partial [Cucurbita argyrosperma subsp. sororia]